MPTVHTFSEQGQHRHNEDALRVVPHPDDERWWLAALADGQGGQPGGQRASALACDEIIRHCQTFDPSTLGLASTWVGLLGSADAVVASDPQAGYTTVVAFAVGPTHVIGASNGDSALWATSDGQVIDLTERQDKNPPIGSSAASITPFGWELPHQWKLLATTDGVWKYASLDTIASALRDLHGEPLLTHLRESARLPSGAYQDDCTAILIEEDNR